MTKGVQLFIGFLLIAFMSIEVPTRAFRQYEKGDIDKALETLEKSLEKDKLNPAGNFLYSVIFIDTAFNGYSIDSAYHFVNKAIANYQMVKEPKDLDDLKDVGVNTSSLEQLKDRVDALKFAIVKSQHTIADYNKFIQKHKDAEQVPEAIALRNHIAFENASEVDTWQSYLAFVEAYPRSEDFDEANKRYKKLLFEDKTADGKLESLTSFLDDYAATPYRSQVEADIYNISTSANTIESYTDFLTEYPNSQLAKESAPLLYHLFKEQFPQQDFFEFFKFKSLTDSLQKAARLEASFLLPKIEDGAINFINKSGEVVLQTNFTEVNSDCLCSPLLQDFVIGTKNEKQQLVGRNGEVFYEGNFVNAKDAGFGYVLLEKEEGFILIHKNGETIIDTPMESIAVLNQHFIRTQQNDFYGLTTISKKQLLSNEFIDIDTIANFIWLQKEEGIALVRPEELFPAADGQKINLQFDFEEVELLDNGDFLVVKNGQEAILWPNLETKIAFGDHRIYPKNYGWQLKSARGIQLLHENHNSLSDLLYQKVIESSNWLGLKQSGKWSLIDQSAMQPALYGYDSLGLWGENLAMLKKEEKVTAVFANGKKLDIPKGWEPKLLVPQNYIASGEEAKFDFLMITGLKKARKIYNSFGKEILNLTLQDAVALRPNLLRLQKTNAALTDSTGNYVLNFVYDGIGSNNNGYVSILDNGKVGVINVEKNIKIAPKYDKLLEPYSDTVLVATKGKLKGFITTSGKELSAFDYDEIRFFTDSIALGRIENEWFLHRIKDEALRFEGILEYEFITESENEKVMLITTESGKGVYSTRQNEIIDATYDEIKVLGTKEDPIYFAVKVVREANIYVVIYFDKNGNKLFTQSFKQDEYFKIACPKN